MSETPNPTVLDKNKDKSEPVKDDVPMIVFRQPYTENGVQMEKVHGPMPVSEWAAYEKEHNL